MLKKSTNNTFDKGLLMDFNPIVTPNNVLTNCLNGTIITFNGNEYALQNDMGNGRVETAYLPEGYIPMGTAELGGIIYIVSYNPLTDRCQIGSFPSPERNISSDESPTSTNLVLSTKDFYLHWDEDEQHNTPLYNRIIKSTTQKLTLTTSNLYPGDKFQISSPDISDARQYLSAYNNYEENADLDPRYLKFSIISIDDSGNINNMNSDLIWSTSGQGSGAGKYYIREDEISDGNGNVTLDEYRTLVNSNYNIFQGLTAGKLGVLAELECIDTFNVSYYIQTKQVTRDTGENMTYYTVYLLLNWSYNNSTNRNPINLYGVKVSGTVVSDYYPMGYSTINDTLLFDKYPQYINSESNCNLSNTDILKNKDVTFANPNYYSITEFIEKCSAWEEPDNDKQNKYDDTKHPYYNNSTEPRQNDGSDNQYIIKAAQIAVKQGSTGTIHLEVSPCMPFGVIDYLKQSFTIDLEKIGSGEFNLNKYQYYNTNETWTIDLGFENYPEEGHEFRDLTVSFYELNDTIYKQLIKGTTNSYEYNGGSVFDNCNTTFNDGQEIWANKKEALPNNIKCDLTLTDPVLEYNISGVINGNYTIQANALSNTNVYIVKINFDYYNNQDNSSDSFSYYRLFYSSDIFNNKRDILDYGQIKYGDLIQINTSCSTSNLNDPTVTIKLLGNSLTETEKDDTGNYQYQNSTYSYIKTNDHSFNSSAKYAELEEVTYSFPLINNISYTVKSEELYFGNSLSAPVLSDPHFGISQVINTDHYTSIVGVDLPILYAYNQPGVAADAYIYSSLNVGDYYMSGSGDADNAWIKLASDRESAVGTSDNNTFHSGNNVNDQMYQYIPDSYGSAINSYMQDNNYDILLIEGTMKQTRNEKTWLRIQTAGGCRQINSYLEDSEGSWLDSFAFYIGFRTAANPYFKIYSIDFTVLNAITTLPQNIFGNLSLRGTTCADGEHKYTLVAYNDDTEQFRSTLKSLFRRIYKKMPNTKQEKTTVYWISGKYKNYEIQYNITVNIDSIVQVKLNGVGIAENLKINNLNYHKNISIKQQQFQIEEVINTTSNIEEMEQTSTSFAKRPDNTIEIGEIDNAIYYYSNNGFVGTTDGFPVPSNATAFINQQNYTISSNISAGSIDNSYRLYMINVANYIGINTFQIAAEGNGDQAVSFIMDPLQTYYIK